MKQLLLLPVLCAAGLLTGCSKPAGTDVTMTKQPVFMKGAPTPFELQLKNGADAATGYAVKASFSMARMDHGQLEVTLNEASPGTYAGEVPLPMGGEWDVAVKAEGRGKTFEKTLTVKVNDGG